jgi:hypothetical protein
MPHGVMELKSNYSFARTGRGCCYAVGLNGTILTSEADPAGVAFKTGFRKNLSEIKINISKSAISAMLPIESTYFKIKTGLFNVAGKQIYSATT